MITEQGSESSFSSEENDNLHYNHNTIEQKSSFGDALIPFKEDKD